MKQMVRPCLCSLSAEDGAVRAVCNRCDVWSDESLCEMLPVNLSDKVTWRAQL